MAMSGNTAPRAAAPADETAPPGEEVLYRSERTLITRRRPAGDSGGVVLKRAIGAEAAQRLRREGAILERLAGVDGVPRLAQGPVQDDLLALRDTGGTPLSRLLQARRSGEGGGMALAPLLDLACALARVLAGVHRAGVVHKDVNPSNILVEGPGLAPTLIDFNIAGDLAEERPGFTHQRHIAGTLPYMAPEQTGRTGRAVDQRADLYSLGATLYELATGRKPFESGDLLELVHCHLVQRPRPPVEISPGLPRLLSDMVMRLLEKEPDHRYQSADGLAQDLQRLRDAMADGEADPDFPLGRHDFAPRLKPPSRLIGRDAEIAVLRDAVERSIDGAGPCLLVAGMPGVGKTALIDELRPMVTARRGWFVSCKFDQYRQDAPAAAVEALRALGRLLLAEPEAQLALDRARMAERLGANLGFGPCLLPEFALLLGRHPPIEVSNPREAEARMVQATIDLLRGIASAERPVVMVYDDLQWAPAITLRFIDAVVTAAAPIPGLLLVGAYRGQAVDAAHPLSALLARWEDLGLAVPRLLLGNLPPSHAGALIGEMLRLSEEQAGELAAALAERTGGNPYDTVELVNTLRQDGLLVPQGGGWIWDASSIRDHIGNCGVVDLLGRRIARLPADSRALLETMACLGGDVRPALLRPATGLDDDALRRLLAPALEDSLLVTEQGGETSLRFRHDRVQQAVFEGMDALARRGRHLALARRLIENPALQSEAAEQYLPAVEALLDPASADTGSAGLKAERRRAAALFHRAAARVRALNFDVTERFLASAVALIRADELPQDEGLLYRLEVERHRALYGLGRLDEADAVYESIVRRCADPMDRVEAAGVQMYSLHNRSRYAEGVALGLKLLAELGLPMPADPRPAIDAGFSRLAAWNAGSGKQVDFQRPPAGDPRVLAWARLIVKTANAAYFGDTTALAWLVLESHRLWAEHGPCSQLMPSMGFIPFLLAGARQDHRGAYESARHLVAVGEARGFEPGTSVARYIFAVAAGHWMEPIENSVEAFRQARAELMREGDFQFASYTYMASDLLLDCAATLDPVAPEVEAGLAFAARTGNTAYIQRYLPRRQLIRALRGQTRAPGGFSDDSFDEADYVANLGEPGIKSATYHILRTVSAAVFGDMPRLANHTAQAMPVLARLPGYYLTAVARALRGLSLADQARGLPPGERGPLLRELDEECLPWIARRAEDAPVNFLHLVRWLQAERAWAAGEVWAAGAAFDAAMDEAALHPRPWHRALIVERAALFHLAQGMEASGGGLLARACGLYEAWGASGKVEALRRGHACLRRGAGPLLGQVGVRSTTVSSEVVDMMAVLRASQALSSETSLARLTDRVALVLSAMTGATGVRLVVRPDGGEDWFMSASLGVDGGAVTAEEAGASGELPLSVFRYAERTGEVLVIEDATRDDRFSADPYLAGPGPCAMLLAPVMKQGRLHAMLLLESRQMRGAFTADRLDLVTLIAGQLSVSLDNALLYASLERKVAERTAALEEANRRMEQLSLTDALTGLPNRRRFNDALQSEWVRALRSQRPLGLAMIDIDHFKLYNDHYGHQGGDACLQLVADAMSAELRATDLLARYGGEEFVLLLPDTEPDGACLVAERLRAAVHALAEPHLRSPLGAVTISVGIASAVPSPETDAAGLVGAADAALYASKRAGRNRVAGPP